MTDSITYRPAQPGDARFIAEMIDISSDGVAVIEWAETARSAGDRTAIDVGEQCYASEAGDYSYRNCILAGVAGRNAGMLLSFPMPAKNPADAAAAPPFDGSDVFAPYKYLEAPDTWYICGVAVTPDRRGSGIGRRLLEIAREQAVAHGYDRLSLVVFEENAVAIRLYRQLGYAIVDRAPVVPHPLIRVSGDALLMVAPAG